MPPSLGLIPPVDFSLEITVLRLPIHFFLGFDLRCFKTSLFGRLAFFWRLLFKWRASLFCRILFFGLASEFISRFWLGLSALLDWSVMFLFFSSFPFQLVHSAIDCQAFRGCSRSLFRPGSIPE